MTRKTSVIQYFKLSFGLFPGQIQELWLRTLYSNERPAKHLKYMLCWIVSNHRVFKSHISATLLVLDRLYWEPLTKTGREVNRSFLTYNPSKMAALLICYLTVIYFSSAWALPVDVARNRPVDAQITCGALGLETFVSQKWQWSGGDVRENHTEICYDATTHPPSAMVDGDDSTFWQSTARPNFNQAPQGPEIFITLDMQQASVLFLWLSLY